MFQEFLKTIPRYKSMYILEQTGDIKKIIRISKMHGKVTDGKLLIYHSETKKTVIHEIYSNTQGEFILHHRRRIKLVDFKKEIENGKRKK